MGVMEGIVEIVSIIAFVAVVVAFFYFMWRD